MKKAVSAVSRLVWWGVLVVGVAMAGLIILQRQWIVDFWQGMQYTPSAEMAEIQDRLALTDKGEFLFKALQPTLNEAEEFNANCHQTASETAVLGCYTGGKVLVYNILSEELAGIREVTTAHEMLHAVWARMSPAEQEELMDELNTVAAENEGILGGELDNYEAEMRTEEIFVRAGTEVREVPAELADLYAQYFADRGRIVDYYNSYIAVFNAKKERADALEAEIAEMREGLEARIAAYEQQVESLQTDIAVFNQCANEVGCFKNQSAFGQQRENLLRRQEALSVENQGINAEISQYNGKVEEYNQAVDDGRKLEKEINSNGLPDVKI